MYVYFWCGVLVVFNENRKSRKRLLHKQQFDKIADW